MTIEEYRLKLRADVRDGVNTCGNGVANPQAYVLGWLIGSAGFTAAEHEEIIQTLAAKRAHS